MAIHGERAQKMRHLGRAHGCGMALPVKQNIAANPRDVRLLRSAAVMAETYSHTDAIE
jgi:hypothetical protein